MPAVPGRRGSLKTAEGRIRTGFIAAPSQIEPVAFILSVTSAMATPSCPVCAAPSIVEDRLTEVTLCRCHACDHCFTDLASVQHFESYDERYYEQTHRNWFLHPDVGLFEKLRVIISRYKPSASVLDLGCGNGNFLKYLRHADNRLSLTGVDTCPNDPAPGITFVQGDLFETRFDHQFDVVASLAVIEHVPDVVKFAHRLHGLCAPNGLVITMTVDERSLIYRTARGLRHVGFSLPTVRLYDKHHLNHFNHSSLKRLLEQEGLATVQQLRHDPPMNAVDMPPVSALMGSILRAGVRVAFGVGDLVGAPMNQTIVSRKL